VDIAKAGQLETWLKPELPENVKHISAFGLPLAEWLMKMDQYWWNLRRKSYIGLFVTALDRFFANICFHIAPKITHVAYLESKYSAIKVHLPDFFWWQNWKLIWVYKEVLKFEFDYVLVVNNSSYVNVNKLVEYCRQLNGAEIYGGPILQTRNITFVSGSSRLLSRNVIEKIFNNRNIFDLWRVEDVQFGKVAKTLGFSPTNIESTVISSTKFLNQLTDQDLNKSYHFRVKSGPLKARQDVLIMQSLHNRLSRGCGTR
jgi:hypothetical protein